MSITSNVPIQMFSTTNTTGEMIPLKFRFEDQDHTVQTVKIDTILGCQECNYVGQKGIKYVCSTTKEGYEVLFEIKFLLLSHKWILLKVLN